MTETVPPGAAPGHATRLSRANAPGALDGAAVHDHTRHAIALYYRALCGQICSLAAYDDGSSPWEHADTETTVWLPAGAPLDDHADFTADDWYQVAMTHRAMHQRLGTFDLDLDRDEPLFRRLRPAPAPADGLAVPALERLAALFGHSLLGVHIFATCEDLRIDAATDRLYPGLASAARGVHHGALHERPQPAALFPRAAAIEALVRFSLGGSLVLAATALEEPIARITAVARLLRDPRATATSSVEAALRICDVLASLPAAGAYRAVHELRFADTTADPDDPRCDVSTLPGRLAGAEGFAGWYVPVAYRDWPGPRYVGEAASDLSLAALLPQVAQRSATLAPADDPGGEAGEETRPRQPAPAEAAPADQRDLTPNMRLTAALPGTVSPDSHAAGPLAPRAPNEFTYPEWDVYAGRHLPAHTRVRVLPAAADRSDHRHYRALARYGHEVSRMVRSLERVRPEGRTVTRRAVAGDDLDLDGCVDALIDLRAGVEPGDRLFTDLRRPLREVTVAFAIDLSGSTAIALPPDPEAPGTLRRVLDLQCDAVSLVAHALQRTGDEFGIYGFSGSGRDDVRLSVVKDVAERHTPAVWHRLSGLAPDHTTRIGPAIRHLTSRLRSVDSATKLLIVVSDGCPYDIDYGQRYGDEAVRGYAVGDTAKALEEARASGVSPYLITVDPDGDDYLGGACDPRSYHVIADAADLPEALADLYVAVRANATAPRSPSR